MSFFRPAFFALATLLLTLPAWAEKAPRAKIGQAAPDFELTDTHGKKHKLSSLQGKFVILEWLNHECPFVVKHYKSGNMQKLQRYAAEKGAVWFSIVSSAPGKQGHYEPAKANAITKEKNAAPAAVLLDPEGHVGKSYKAKTTPHMYVIDTKGTLVYAGAIDSIRSTSTDDIPKAKNYVQAALDQAMSGKQVEIPRSRPYGCSVKYK